MYLVPPNIHNDPVEVIGFLRSVTVFCVNGMASCVEHSEVTSEDATGFNYVMKAVTDAMEELQERMHADRSKSPATTRGKSEKTYPRTDAA